jgi:beta-phosphoglucomutase
MKISKNNIAFIFDMDGVLVDNFHFHNLAWKEFCKDKQVTIPLDELKNILFGRTNNEIMPMLFGQDISVNDIQKLSDEKEAAYRKVYEGQVKPVKGLISLLESFYNNDIPLAVASSGPMANIMFVLQNLNIANYFTVIVSGDEVTHGKPHPEIYLKTSGKMGVKPDNCFVFEDSYAGIESAKNAGMKVIGVATTHPKEKLKDTILNISHYEEFDVKDIYNINSPLE